MTTSGIQNKSSDSVSQSARSSAPASSQDKSLANNYVLAQINQAFKSDKAFHAVVVSKSEFGNLLSLIGKVPFQQRDHITRNLNSVIGLNPKLLQDTTVLERITTLLKNSPTDTQAFQGTATTILTKIREALIRNRQALNLYNPVMAEYSETIRKFLSLIPQNIKGEYLSSFDEDILNFIMGKATRKQREEARQKKATGKTGTVTDSAVQGPFSEDDESEDEGDDAEDRRQKLIKMMFSDVMRLEPELVSAVILTLVSQLPHGNMVIEDRALTKSWMTSMNI